jgi:D-psicose/D-tagatose/L-ribulose 3-epimerase
MDIGICSPTPAPQLANRLVAAGCNYYEPSMARAVMLTPASDFTAAGSDPAATWTVGGLAPMAAGNLVPGTLPVVGDHRDWSAVASYLTDAVARATALGTEVLVFGSGASRRVPEGFGSAEARGQFAEALRLALSLAGPTMSICAEHMTRSETNLLNTVADTASLLEEFDLEGVLLTVDLYHLTEESEPLSVIDDDVARIIGHVHVCGAADRRAPIPGDEEFLLPFFDRLAAAGYAGRCSIECRWQDLEAEAPQGVTVVRQAAERAGLRP